MVTLITGASGFIGGAIAERVIDRADVRSLTFHPGRNRFGDRVRSFRYDFDEPTRMADAFRGVDVFVNSYYVRFDYGSATFERAVDQSRALIAQAVGAGVGRIVHVSVSNADERSDLRYYANKARIERLVRESGLPYTILRPAIVVGPGDILVNNIAFFLRRLPVFTIFGRGTYRAQPMTLDAFAEIAFEAIDGRHENTTLAVAGPADWRFLDMVRAVRTAVDSHAVIVPAPAWAARAGLRVAGLMLRDVVLTADEIRGLTREYLYVPDPVRRGADFGAWLASGSTAAALGRTYASELGRHFDGQVTAGC
jgi:NADH dehydrogenase